MIKDYDLQSIITSLLLIASADGALNEKDKKIISSYLNKYYKSGKIAWTRPKPISRSRPGRFYADGEGEPYDILKEAVETLNTTSTYTRHGFFSSLECLDLPIRNEVLDLWMKLADGSQNRVEVYTALYQTVYVTHRW